MQQAINYVNMKNIYKVRVENNKATIIKNRFKLHYTIYA